MVRLRYVDLLLLFILNLNPIEGKKSCDTTNLVDSECYATETCTPSDKDTKHGFCDCLPGYNRINDTFCQSDVPPTPKSSSLIEEDSGNNHIVAGILIPIFLITVVICGIYISRKYKLLNYVRSKLNQRNNNYDEVMIGQDLDDDDPPIR